ncbi:MAG TPA: ribokinase [Anaerolineae bacterium]|nr:ribokinase [Anaerolineae bacterium]
MADIVVIGSLNMDLVVRTARRPQAGETVSGSDFQTIPGGKGANQAVAAARCGGRVSMLGRVGQDVFGPALVENLVRCGVDATHVHLDAGAPTGTALIVVDGEGQNSIVVVPGANGHVDRHDVNRLEPLWGRARYLLLQLEVPLPAVSYAVETASRHGVRIILNAAPACPAAGHLLSRVDFLVVNELEAQALSGVPVTGLEAAAEAARQLLARGVPIVILTLGRAGALLATEAGMHHVPARKVAAVDTTAAGDAFIGALAVALFRSFPLTEAVRYATCAGTLAVTRFGAQTSLPSQAEVEAFFVGDGGG